MRLSRRRHPITLLFLLALLASACSNVRSHWMHPAAASQLRPAPGLATLVVMRPSSAAYKIRFTLVNDQGSFFGQPLPESHYLIQLQPGRHRVVGWSEDVEMVELNVEADRTYYLLAEAHLGWWKAGIDLTPVRTSDADFAKVATWLAESTPHLVDFAGGQHEIDRNAANVRARIASAVADWNSMSVADRAALTMQRHDGYRPASIAAPPVTAAPPP
mgnify:CR=1 FL=1